MAGDHAEEGEDCEDEAWYEELIDVDEKTAIELDTVTAFWAETDDVSDDWLDDADLAQHVSDAA